MWNFFVSDFGIFELNEKIYGRTSLNFSMRFENEKWDKVFKNEPKLFFGIPTLRI